MLGNKSTEIKISTLLGKDSECVGDFNAKGSVRLDGRVNGDVTVTGALIVGASGTVNGNITAESVMIGGEVLGDIKVTEKAELMETARVLGDITTKVIVIDENAVFQGNVNMNQEVPDKKAKPNNRVVRAGRKSAKAAIAEALKEVQEEASKEEAGREETKQEETPVQGEV